MGYIDETESASLGCGFVRRTKLLHARTSHQGNSQHRSLKKQCCCLLHKKLTITSDGGHDDDSGKYKCPSIGAGGFKDICVLT